MSARSFGPAAPMLACGIALLLAGADPFLIAIAPVALLVGALLGGCYPGERVIGRLRGAARGQRPSAQPAVEWPRTVAARRQSGGALIGASLAGRAPPTAFAEALASPEQ